MVINRSISKMEDMFKIKDEIGKNGFGRPVLSLNRSKVR